MSSLEPKTVVEANFEQIGRQNARGDVVEFGGSYAALEKG
jgi:hypothetical protein